VIIIITTFMSKLFHKLSSSSSLSCVHHKLLYKLSSLSYVYGKTAKLLSKLCQWMSQLTPMCLQSSIAFCKHQVAQYIISHVCLWGYTMMSPWLKILSIGTALAGTQYIELTNLVTWICSLQRMFLTVAFGDKDANSRYDCTVLCTGAVHSWSWNFSRPTLQDRDQDHKYQDQDQDCIKLVSSALETKTAVLRTTPLFTWTHKVFVISLAGQQCFIQN